MGLSSVSIEYGLDFRNQFIKGCVATDVNVTGTRIFTSPGLQGAITFYQ
jgi:hypothetical protein